jgi:hypothetical protein
VELQFRKTTIHILGGIGVPRYQNTTNFAMFFIKNLKNIPILFAFLFLGNTIFAQESTTAKGETYFFLGVALPIVKVRDVGHSPQIYQGLGPTLRVGYERIGQKQVARVMGSVTFGGTKPKSKPKSTRQLSSGDITQINFSYAYYQNTNKNYVLDDWNGYVGGAFTVMVDMRGYDLPSNNLLGFQMNTSLNIGGFANHSIDRHWQFNYEAFTPILSYSVRPNYVGMFPISVGSLAGRNVTLEMLKAGKLVTVNKLCRFYNRFSFDQHINDHRQRRFSYAWDMLHNRVSQPMTSVMGGFGYESLFKM